MSVVGLVAFEAMAVATVLPVTVAALGGLAAYAWAFSAFLGTSLVGMVQAGGWADRVGPRGPLLTGLAAFAAGLVVAGSAPSMAVLVLGRAVQGWGAGLVIVALYVVVARVYPDRLRPRVFSAISAAWVLPAVVGPVLAGWVAQQLSWRWVFLGAVPLVAFPVALLLSTLRALRPTGAPAATPRRSGGRRRWAPVAAVGAGLLQYAGQYAGQAAGPAGPRGAALGLLPAAVGAALLVPAVPRLLPPGTVRGARGLPATVALRGLFAGAFFGAEAFLPLMLVTHRGLSPALAGLTLTGGALGWATGSWYQGRPATRAPRARLVRVGGLVVAAGVATLTAVLLPAVPPLLAAAAWATAGLGMGLGLTSLSVELLRLSAPADQGANSASLQIADSLGSILCIAAGGTLFAAGQRAGEPAAVAFGAVWVLMVLVALGAALLAARLPATAGAAGHGPGPWAG